MSGHSKWSTIKRQKGANDAKRGALFTKVTREIMIAARQGGGDPDANYRLRLAVDKARRPPINMPADNIKRAIERATGAGDAEVFEEIIYEGYGPGGVAILVEAQTDNRNRTAADVRSLFTKSGGQLAGSGAVAWQFEPRGLITIPKNGQDADEVALTAIDAGADDVDTSTDEVVEVYTTPAGLEGVRKALEGAGVPVDIGREHDDRQEHGRGGRAAGAPEPPPRRVARGPGRRPARDGQLRHSRGAVRRGCGLNRRAAQARAGRPVIVLGIDPGTAALGYGVIESKSARLRMVNSGTFVTKPDASLPQRLLAIHALLDELIALHQPDLVAVERLFFSKNVQTAFAVGQARGVVLLAAAQARGAGPRGDAERGQGRGHRPRSGREGPGRRGWSRSASGSPRRLRPTTRPTPWPWPSGPPTRSGPASSTVRPCWIAPPWTRSRSGGAGTAAVATAHANGYERAVKEAIAREEASKRR